MLWQEFFWLSLTLFLLGCFLGGWIGITGIVDQHVKYWEQIRETAHQLDATRNPEVWLALGVNRTAPAPAQWLNNAPALEPPQTPALLGVGRHAPEEPVLHQSLFQPGIPATKMQAFTDAILLGRNLAEGTWAGKGKLMSSPEFRNLKQLLRHHKLIRAINPQNRLLGDCLTAKGQRELLKYASPAVQAQKQSHPTPPLLTGGATLEA
jgi:hypothetical protein